MDLFEIKKLLGSGKSIFDLPLRVAYYARVSTEKESQINSLGNQIKYYEEYIRQNEKWEYIGGYVDEGFSGTSVKYRENFLRMIEDGTSGLFDLIVTKEISRFSRNTLDSIKYTQHLLRSGVGVYFQSDNINTFDPDAELRLTIMSSIAQDEVRRISERVKFGFKRAIDNGRILGQNNMIGYDKKDGALTIIEEEAEFVKKVFEIYVEGKFGLRRIARELEKQGYVDSTGKMFTFATLRSIIRNPKYKGYYCGRKSQKLDYRDEREVVLDPKDWIMYKDDKIPAIVSEELWDAANALLKNRGENFKERRDAYQSRYTYSGKLICSEHNTSYHRHVYKSKRFGERECWNCKMYRLKGKIEGCDSPTIYTSELNQIMTGVYEDIYSNRERLIGSLINVYNQVLSEVDASKDINRYENEIESLYRKKEKLLELSIEGMIDNNEFGEMNKKLTDKINVASEKIQELSMVRDKSQEHSAQLSKLKQVLENEWNGSYNESITAVMLDKIIVHKTEAKSKVKLEIYLTSGLKYFADLDKGNYSISLNEIGISQAQVSRLEKSALKHMQKYVSTKH